MNDPISKKDLANIINNQKLDEFKRSAQRELFILPLSIWPIRLFGAESIRYTKKPVELNAGNTIDIIDEDKKAHSFTWRTQNQHQEIIAAVRYGILKPQALTSRVISALGGYRLKELERIYEQGIISDKYQEKRILLDITQDRIELCQELERLINSNADAEKIKNTLKHYIEQVEQLRDGKVKELKALEQYDADAVATMQEFMNADILAARKLLRRLKKPTKSSLAKLLSATGPDSLATFIKKRMIPTLRQAQTLNQNMTYSRSSGSWLRGDFHSYCEDAMKEINDDKADHHNVILPEHQGIFASAKEGQDWLFDFEHLGKNKEAIHHVFRALSFITKQDYLDDSDPDHIKLVSTELDSTGKPKQFELEKTRFTKWSHAGSFVDRLQRLGEWFVNVLYGIAVGVFIDIGAFFVGLFRGIAKDSYEEPEAIAEYYKLKSPNLIAENTKFAKLTEKMNLKPQSLGAKLGYKLGKFLKNTILEFTKGIVVTLKNARLVLFDDIRNDYRLGHAEPQTNQEIMDRFFKKLAKLENKKSEKMKKLAKKIHKELNRKVKQGYQKKYQEQHYPLTSQLAEPPYALTPCYLNDITNAIPAGLKIFLEKFTHNVQAKHSFIGMIFNFAYVAGFLAVQAPETVRFLGERYINFSNAIGSAVTHGSTMGISSGFTQAQIFAGISEAMIHGRKSWLAKGAEMFEKDPSDILIYTGLAVGLGYLIACKLNIPWLSERLYEELGDFPIPALASAGAKVGVLLVELFEREHTDKKIAAAKKQLLKELKKSENQALLAMFAHQQLVPHLSPRVKRDMIEWMKRDFAKHPALIDAVQDKLYPEEPQSIIGETMSLIVMYPLYLLRCLATVVTWNTQPWIEFAAKIQKDLTRLATAVSTLVHTIGSFVRVMVRGVFDILGNEIVARIEGLIRDKHHAVSSATYAVSSSVDSSYAEMRQLLSIPIDASVKQITKPAPECTLQKELFSKRRLPLSVADSSMHGPGARRAGYRQRAH